MKRQRTKYYIPLTQIELTLLISSALFHLGYGNELLIKPIKKDLQQVINKLVKYNNNDIH